MYIPNRSLKFLKDNLAKAVHLLAQSMKQVDFDQAKVWIVITTCTKKFGWKPTHHFNPANHPVNKFILRSLSHQTSYLICLSLLRDKF